MIAFNSETEFQIENEINIANWISTCIKAENYREGEINYIFCNDEYLLKKNIKYLNHNILTDIISFDYTLGKLISGDVFISTERVKENAIDYNVSFDNELHRVIIHGILHFCGYKDKTQEEKELMRSKEDNYLSLRTF